MTQKVKVSYSNAGLQPPVYFAGSLGDQPWEPVEMHHIQKEDGEFDFWQEFSAEEGEYQYKYRLGPGDWWVLDETKDIVDDGAGNRNNLLIVKPQSPKDSFVEKHAEEKKVEEEKVEEKKEEKLENAPPAALPVPSITVQAEKEDAVEVHVADQATAPIQRPDHSTSKLDTSTKVPPTEAKAATPEVFHHVNGTDSEQAPAFAHEAAVPGSVKIVSDIPNHESKEHAPVFDDEPVATATVDPTELEVFDDDDDDEQVSSPLFRHESLSSIRTQDDDLDDLDNHAPLFRHESMSPVESRFQFPSKSARSGSASSYHFDAEDVNDPTLEKFPTEHDGIMAHLQRTESRLHEDDVVVEGNALSPVLSTHSLSAAVSPSLSLSRENTEHLDCIDESEELSPESPTEPQGLGINPDEESHKSFESARENTEAASKISFASTHEPVNRGPLTPPMTPIDESQTNGGSRDGTFEDFNKSKPSHLNAPLSPEDRKDNSSDNVASRSTSKSSLGSSNDKEDHGKITSFWGWVGKLCGGTVSTLGVAVAVGVAAVFYAVTGKISKSEK